MPVIQLSALRTSTALLWWFDKLAASRSGEAEDYIVLSFVSLNFLCIERNRSLLPKLEGWEKESSVAFCCYISTPVSTVS